MQVFGHRGAAGHVAENTLASFRKAISLDVDGIEFDVRVTRDCQPVVIHDATIDRTSSESGTVAELSLKQLRELTREESEMVPTLEETLTEIGPGVRVNVELKELAAGEPTLAVLNDCVAAGAIRSADVLVTSFEHEAVERFRSKTRDFAVGLLTKGIPKDSYWELAKSLKAVSANIDLASVDRQFVRRAQDAGVEVMVYTVNTKSDADRMRELGVDAIFSDYPDRVG